MKVAVSAVSSYSGMCIAEAFANAGASVTGTVTRNISDYSGRQRHRLERVMRAGVELASGLRAEDGSMAAWVAARQLDVWVHHHHPMTDFRSPNYDVVTAKSAALRPLPQLARAWRKAGVETVIQSGTYFEPGEGGRPESAPSTPYARLKLDVAKVVAELAEENAIAATKIVITTPTGALENEDRLTPGLLLAADRGEPFTLRSPQSVFDSISGEALGKHYVTVAEECLSGDGRRVHRPSGWRVSGEDWCNWVRSKIAEPLGLALELRTPKQAEQTSPVEFFNPKEERVDMDWDEVAHRYVDEWRASYPFR